jgi:hypothetical protein
MIMIIPDHNTGKLHVPILPVRQCCLHSHTALVIRHLLYGGTPRTTLQVFTTTLFKWPGLEKLRVSFRSFPPQNTSSNYVENTTLQSRMPKRMHAGFKKKVLALRDTLQSLQEVADSDTETSLTSVQKLRLNGFLTLCHCELQDLSEKLEKGQSLTNSANVCSNGRSPVKKSNPPSNYFSGTRAQSTLP